MTEMDRAECLICGEMKELPFAPEDFWFGCCISCAKHGCDDLGIMDGSLFDIDNLEGP